MKNQLLLLLVFCVSLSGVAQTNYLLGKESKLTIDGTSTIHDWTVTANTISGTLKAEGTVPKEIDFQVAVADIKSERGSTMDKKTHNALKMENHPEIVFTLKEVQSGSSVVGTLSMAGKKKEIEISTIIITSDNDLKISGEYPITLQDWDIEPPTAMFGQVIVGDDVTVKFDLIFEKE